MALGQRAEAASTPCHAEAVSIGSRVCHDGPRSPRANLQRRRCHGHARWRHGRPIDGVHCVNACPRQAWFVCVQTLPCSTVSKGRKSRAGIAVAICGSHWHTNAQRQNTIQGPTVLICPQKRMVGGTRALAHSITMVIISRHMMGNNIY